MNKKLLINFFLLCICSQFPNALFAQISGIVNTYTRVNALNTDYVDVSSSAGFSAGDLVLLIQMQGASVTSGVNTADFGNITALNSAGHYEFLNVMTVEPTRIYFSCAIQRTYSTTGAVQLVRVPQYTDVSVVGTLDAQAWNGDTGGVLAIDVSGILTLNANINASERGFRGGAPIQQTGYTCSWSSVRTNFFYQRTAQQLGANKGEGIAKEILNEEGGKGKLANAGGGGNDHNSGGGGGSNAGVGGQGGERLNTTSFDCKGAHPGLGGAALTYSSAANRLFMGGGGGSGHGNNTLSAEILAFTPGGHGGGLVIIRANTIVGNGNSIISNGQQPKLSAVIFGYSDASSDGAGGGGAGGTIVLHADNFSTPLALVANGGQGGNHVLDLFSPTKNCMGLGGGGGGGAIVFKTATVPAGVTTSVTGGPRGAYIDLCSGSTNMSTNGANGVVINSFSLTECLDEPPLPVQLLHFDAKPIHDYIALRWQTTEEVDNKGFEIQRAQPDGTFQPIGFESATKNPSAINHYQYNDFEPIEGLAYYRLMQIDHNGNTSFSPIKAVMRQSESQQFVRLYPNPAQNQIRIDMDQQAGDDFEYVITATNGQICMKGTYAQGQINIADLQPGMYMITLTNLQSGKQQFGKFIKTP